MRFIAAGQGGEFPFIPVLEHDRSLQFVAEFADVSVPRMSQQPRPAGGADWLRRKAVTLAELRQQMLRECQDVVYTIAQRWIFSRNKPSR